MAFGLHGLKMFFSWEESRSTSQAQRRAEVSPFQAVLAPEADRRCERGIKSGLNKMGHAKPPPGFEKVTQTGSEAALQVLENS